MPVPIISLSEMNRDGRKILYSWDEIVYNAQATFGPRMQNSYQLVVVLSGHMQLTLNQRETVTLCRGQGIWLVPETTEFFAMSCTEKTRHWWIHADPDLYKNSGSTELPPHQRVFTHHDELQSLANRLLHSGVLQVDFPHGYLPAIADAACWWALEQLGLGGNRSLARHPAVVRALALIHNAYPDPLDLPTLARRSGVSPQQLTRLFQQSHGTSPVRYLWHYRDEQAVRLLRDSGLSISEIASRCGYANPYHLTRRITRHYGVPPRALRQQFWNP